MENPELSRPSSFASITWPDGECDSRPDPAAVEEGDSGPTLLTEGISSTDFVRCTRASGDFNLILYDQDYARRLGNRNIFGQGMITACYASTVLSNWFGIETVTQFRNRFTARVWPGDILTVTGVVVGVKFPLVDVAFSIAREGSEVVLQGDAPVDFSG
ncbi:hypothetical protein HYG82_23105 (plasmid) [Natrinema halophilum]|nr:MaoC/PaaZ C-terminal domain-containing protein [Natrinema halophilum]UHQ96400.1 hypothetical protein HYG82_23105 [Natrinema halophilum]